MRLTYEQQTIVEENMGLVGKVIKDKVHGLGQDTAFCYDDLFKSDASAYVRLQLQTKVAVFLHMPTA